MEPHVLYEPTLKFRWLREWGARNILQQEVRVLRPSRTGEGSYEEVGCEWRDIPAVEINAEDEPCRVSREAV